MNEKEIGEIRRHLRRDRCNMTAIYGCYVNENREIISQFRRSLGTMPENESEKYFALLKRTLSGTVGKNLIDITFRTDQVAGSEEHKLLMDLRSSGLQDEQLLETFYKKVIETVNVDGSYLILMGCDRYDVPFKNKGGETDLDSSEEVYQYLVCAICPVKQTKANLHYVPEEKEFHDGGMLQTVAAPALGFLFPAFDDRTTNIYNALYYTHDIEQSNEDFVTAVFNAPIPQPAAAQRKAFEALLSRTLENECNLDVVQTVHDQLCQRIELHKESKTPETLMISKEEVKDVLKSCGVTEPHVAKFSVDYDEAFGFEAQLHPKNIIDNRHFEIHTPDVSIKVAPNRSDLIETRVIGGIKYILINAQEDVEVNGVSIHIGEPEEVPV